MYQDSYGLVLNKEHFELGSYIWIEVGSQYLVQLWQCSIGNALSILDAVILNFVAIAWPCCTVYVLLCVGVGVYYLGCQPVLLVSISLLPVKPGKVPWWLLQIWSYPLKKKNILCPKPFDYMNGLIQSWYAFIPLLCRAKRDKLRWSPE